MDKQTLEYMGSRVDKARELQRAINAIDEKIKHLKTKFMTSVRFTWGDSYTIVGKDHMGLPDNSIVSLIKEAAITCLEDYRDTLQRELDEL